jgi:hypothetical protein
MAKYLWIKFKDSYPVKVPAQHCSDVDDFLEACKKKLAPSLDSISIAFMCLSTSERTLKRSEAIPEHNTEDTALIVTTIEETGICYFYLSPLLTYVRTVIRSVKKQRPHKEMSVEASCQKFLDALAYRISNLYNFQVAIRNCPTIGDVFSAYDKEDKEDWVHRRIIIPNEEREKPDEDGYRQANPQIWANAAEKSLPELFSREGWCSRAEFR